MNPWEEDYSKPVEKKPWEEDYSKPPAKEPGYLKNVAQPMVNAEVKLHARSNEFNALPLAQKPARFINDLAGGLGDVVTGLAGSVTNLIPQKAQAAIGGAIEKPVQALGRGLGAVGQAAADVTPQPVKNLGSNVAGAVKGFSEQHPILTEYAKAVPNAALLAAPAVRGASRRRAWRRYGKSGGRGKQGGFPARRIAHEHGQQDRK